MTDDGPILGISFEDNGLVISMSLSKFLSGVQVLSEVNASGPVQGISLEDNELVISMCL